MSTEFEEAVIAFAQSLKADRADDKTRAKCRRQLEKLIDWEFDRSSGFGIALMGIVRAASDAVRD